MINRILSKETVANILATARTKSGLSQKEMAKRMDVSVGTINNWEQSVGSPSIIDFMNWFDVLGQNPLRPLLDVFFPGTYENLNDISSEREALIKYLLTTATDNEIDKLAYNIFTNTGSSWHAQLEMLTAHNHTTLRSRVNASRVILDSYEMEEKEGKLVQSDVAVPNINVLEMSISKGKQSVFDKKKGYV